ncbi:histidinol-phosphate transaminase [Caloranaerobacter sp. DY30410]|uniref:histidinol-phosphate transaminase n=1 Tax=Caloranaerobacter sp. DY30410 TaxID=3238305 RepID=UPI003CFFD2BE
MIELLVKKSILDLKPYIPNDYEYKYKMDANESPFNLPDNVIKSIIKNLYNLKLNRYPDTNSNALRREISKYIGVNFKNIIVGNGSDEMINIIINTFADKNDVVVSHSPTFVMYRLISKIAGVEYIDVPTDEDFNVDIDALIQTANDREAKLIFLCSPNNPTGNLIRKEEIIKVVNETKSVVVVDEAYFEFGGKTIVQEVKNFSRLIVLRTLSKAFGAAGIRTGYLVAGDKIIDRLNSVKLPYNLNTISQLIGIELLRNKSEILSRVRLVNEERDKLYDEMKKIDGIKVYPSSANFILFRVDNGKKVFEGLLDKGVKVRFFSGGRLENHLRVTVGTQEENKAFIDALKEVMKK